MWEYNYRAQLESPEMCSCCAQTPKTDVPQGGIGSSMLFAEDSTLGPEPLLWASPKRFGDPANTKVSRFVYVHAVKVLLKLSGTLLGAR